MSTNLHPMQHASQAELASDVMDGPVVPWSSYCMARKKYPPGALQKRPLRKPFIAKWREYRGITQEALAARASEFLGKEMDVTVLSKIENGKSPYGQRTLEALADALGCQPSHLLNVDPTVPGAIWSIEEALRQADPIERDRIRSVIELMLKKAS